MSLSIRQWLIDRNITITQLQALGAQTAGVAFRIGQDMEVKSLTPFDISPFAELLELPLDVFWQYVEPVCNLSVELLRILSRKKPLKRNEGTWLAFQIAYQRSLQKILEQEFALKRPWLERANVLTQGTADESRPVILPDSQLQALLKTLRPGRLTDTQAEQALSSIGESLLVGQMNNLALAWFVTNGVEEILAKQLVQRLVHALPGHLLTVIAENALPLAQLQKFVRLGHLTNNNLANQILTDDDTITLDPENELSALSVGATIPNLIDLNRENYRANLLQALSEPVLGEFFALKDLYVPLKGVPVEESENKRDIQWRSPTFPSAQSTPSPSTASVDLMEWAIGQLSDLESVVIIEGEPGTGKTSFCQIWAAKIAQEVYPSWMPVFIRLRDVTLGKTLEQTLDTALKAAKLTSADGWLSPLHPPCLLILDGLDELPRAPDVERQFSAFLDRVQKFQSQFAGASGRHRHKIVLTCRSQILASLAHSLPVSFRRMAIQPLDQEQLKLWFKNWSKLQPKSIAQAYFNFLKQSGVFRQLPEVKDLTAFVHQPLSLFLLAILYRSGRLDETLFPLRGSQIRFEIYDRLCRWLLGEAPDGMSSGNSVSMLVREGSANSYHTPEAIASLLQGRSSQEVRHQMQVAAITLLESGRNSCSLSTIATRLAGVNSQAAATTFTLPAFYFRRSDVKEVTDTTTRIYTDARISESVLSPTLPLSHSPTPPLPHSPTPPLPHSPTLSFSHPKLGEYFCAEALAEKLKSLTRRVADAYGEAIFAIDSPSSVAQHLYNSLGYGIISAEIEELLIERLRREEARSSRSFSFTVLLDRLNSFYRAYCRGRWLDEGLVHTTRSQLRPLGNSLNVLQIDATVGLNVFQLLCACHREAQIPFSPCGDAEIPEEFNADRFLSLIGRTAVLSPDAFWARSRGSLLLLDLDKACLDRVMLPGANFWKTNFFAAELVGANLAGSNLQEANLSWANLTDADLSGVNLSAAKLEGANLTGANLMGANLQLASLTNACLFEAQLDEATKDFAEKSGALFSLNQYRACQQALVNLEAGTRHSTIPVTRNVRVNEDRDGDSTLLLIERSEGEIHSQDESDMDNNDETMFL
ncbi:NACHT domain-containing protein [Argonema galeatum]|uniref:NACHT domain-containing protein n=1 Tax=Argonema galeatum TaxID=2942762 RepID=UPI002010C817|nr:pentapeptide repeat-containing protein [Argonema galeatum]MCL1467574.1 pentapeptide repeat-containing protein [Argonema galeatum A003/A1]